LRPGYSTFEACPPNACTVVFQRTHVCLYNQSLPLYKLDMSNLVLT
jgi:hypothetical protein